MLPILQTPRLKLRPWTDADLPELQALFDNAEVRRYLFDGQSVTLERTTEIMRQHHSLVESSALGFWFIEIDGANIGFTGIAGLEGDRCEIMYGLHPGFWNHGYATEAATAVINYTWLASSAVQTIVARTDPPNEASIRVMQRLGMRDAGIEPGPEGQPLIVYRMSRP